MPEKVFINRNNQATFICPKCKRTKTVDASKYIGIDKAIKVKARCSCGHSYDTLLERRKHYRKETNLAGTYIRYVAGQRVSSGIMTVIDISASGCNLRLSASDNFNFNVGDKIQVEFHLDSPTRPQIKKDGTITIINPPNIGIQFDSMDHSDGLGYYLLKTTGG